MLLGLPEDCQAISTLDPRMNCCNDDEVENRGRKQVLQ